jgi:hypothetical protein
MLSGMVSGRTRYSQALGAFDQAAILASLSDDVTIRAHGLNVVGYQPDGLVGELTVFFRPLAAMQLVAEVIGGHMARFGPPPEGLR